MSTVVILQSSYIPWRGYFDLVHESDVFVFHDDLQYTHSDWRSRNKIKTPNGAIWLSIPAGRSEKRLICEVEVEDRSWKKKHQRLIAEHYRRAPFLEKYAGLLDDIYGNTITNLSDFNQHVTKTISSLLGISTEFIDSRILNLEGRRTDRLIDIVKKVDGTRYLSGPAAKDYIEPDKFAAAGIELEYMTYDYPEYTQLYPPFDPQVSILDLLFMVGPEAPKYIWDRN